MATVRVQCLKTIRSKNGDEREPGDFAIADSDDWSSGFVTLRFEYTEAERHRLRRPFAIGGILMDVPVSALRKAPLSPVRAEETP
jgi:hypothetical protein